LNTDVGARKRPVLLKSLSADGFAPTIAACHTQQKKACAAPGSTDFVNLFLTRLNADMDTLGPRLWPKEMS
jgi:hypothetical protein